MSRHWCFTAFSADVSWKESADVEYIVYGRERCPTTGKEHLQGYVCFVNRKRLTGVKKLDSTAHWEIKRGTVRQAVEYCKKDGVVYERGDRPVEERSNANVYSKCIELAESGDMESLKQDYPGQFLRYKRTFDGLLRYPTPVLPEPRGYWIYGAPGSGKDSNVMLLKPFVKSHNKWWDGYAGEKYVLLSDFTRDDMQYLTTYLLQWTDRYPFTAEFKGGSMKISPERFYITSNVSLDAMYAFHGQYEAIKRRFHVIDFDNEVVYKRPKIEFVNKLSLVDF